MIAWMVLWLGFCLTGDQTLWGYRGRPTCWDNLGVWGWATYPENRSRRTSQGRSEDSSKRGPFIDMYLKGSYFQWAVIDSDLGSWVLERSQGVGQLPSGTLVQLILGPGGVYLGELFLFEVGSPKQAAFGVPVGFPNKKH